MLLYMYNVSRQLKHAREGVSHGGLGLLARHRRRQRLKAMLDILKSLKTLVHCTSTCTLYYCKNNCTSKYCVLINVQVQCNLDYSDPEPQLSELSLLQTSK